MNDTETDLIPVPYGSTFLLLPVAEFRAALARGQSLAGAPDMASERAQEPLLTAQELEDKTGIPATWFLDRARQDRLPHYKAGKYKRFKYSEILPALQADVRTDEPPGVPQPLRHVGKK